MSERIRGALCNVLYKSTYTILLLLLPTFSNSIIKSVHFHRICYLNLSVTSSKQGPQNQYLLHRHLLDFYLHFEGSVPSTYNYYISAAIKLRNKNKHAFMHCRCILNSVEITNKSNKNAYGNMSP